MMGAMHNQAALRSGGRTDLVSAVTALVRGDVVGAETALLRARQNSDARLAVELEVVHALILRARGRYAGSAERLEAAAGRVLVEGRLSSDLAQNVA